MADDPHAIRPNPSAPRLNPTIAALPGFVPFVGPEAQERARGRPFRARLGANESLFGASPRAVAAMAEAAAGNWMYSDPESHDLRHALAAFHNVTPANVVIGEGIDGLLGLTVRMCTEPGRTVVTSDGAYPTFNFHVAGHGARLLKVPYRDDREDLGRLLETAKLARAAILYVVNPDNPTGTWWSGAEIEALVARLPPGMLLCLDEAYCDTAPADAIAPLDVGNPQLLRFRTFSKAYGLAGARIGYCLGNSELIAVFEKVRNHYGINRVGQVGALAALADQPHLASAVADIAAARDRIAEIGRASGLSPLPSAANFVALDCGSDGAFAARVLEGLIGRDVFARKPQVPGLDRLIRISAGRPADLEILAETLPAAVAAARTSSSSPGV